MFSTHTKNPFSRRRTFNSLKTRENASPLTCWGMKKMKMKTQLCPPPSGPSRCPCRPHGRETPGEEGERLLGGGSLRSLPGDAGAVRAVWDAPRALFQPPRRPSAGRCAGVLLPSPGGGGILPAGRCPKASRGLGCTPASELSKVGCGGGSSGPGATQPHASC